MVVRLVRCPLCGKRFDISGVSGGARLKCSGCEAVLSVPRTVRRSRSRSGPRRPARAGVQIAVAVLLSLVAGYALSLLFRPGPPAPPPVSRETAQTEERTEPMAEPRRAPANVVFLDRNHDLTQMKIRVREEFGFDRVRFEDERTPFLVVVERSPRYQAGRLLREYADRLMELYSFIRMEFAADLKLPELDEVLPVIVLSSRESYDAYTRRVNDGEKHSPQIRGVYEFTRRRIVLYHDPVAPYEVILHEGAHQLIHAYARLLAGSRAASTTQWFQEGLGTYFEGFRRATNGRILVSPGVNLGRLRAVKYSLGDSSTYTPLKVLTGMTTDAFWRWFKEESSVDDVLATRKAQVFYGESWALVYFLCAKGGDYRRAFNEYLKLELHGKGGKEGFETVIQKYLNMGLEELEREYRRYIQGL